MTECIIFDLGNVLINVNQKSMFARFANNSGKSSKEIEEIYNNSNDRKKFERGEINSIQFYNSMKRDMDLSMDFNEFRKNYTGIFSHNKEMEKIIPKLKKNHRLVLLSNTDELHYKYIKKEFPVLKYFDDFILSYKAGMRKPNPLIFIEAIKKSKTMPWNCVYFDDVREFVWIAGLFGIKGHQYENSEKRKNIFD